MKVDQGSDFETWFCYEVPWKLRLSPSKEVAMHIKFGKFADFVRPLVKKAPNEFEEFFKELQKRIEEVSNFRAPKGTKIAPILNENKYPNGEFRNELFDTSTGKRML